MGQGYEYMVRGTCVVSCVCAGDRDGTSFVSMIGYEHVGRNVCGIVRHHEHGFHGHRESLIV